MDQILDYKNFEILGSKLSDQQLRQKIRLLSVFGCGAAEVIYATIDDKVFGFGRNRFGGLGLGYADLEVKTPTLNTTLTNKQISNVFFGFEHWLALTRSGQCYVWGHNDFGQLGIDTTTPTATPQLVKGLAHDMIIDISCGGFHTLALNSNGQVF
jgi:alpha-tubulin suppressor-like RCC1 family protein